MELVGEGSFGGVELQVDGITFCPLRGDTEKNSAFVIGAVQLVKVCFRGHDVRLWCLELRRREVQLAKASRETRPGSKADLPDARRHLTRVTDSTRFSGPDHPPRPLPLIQP